MTPPRQGIDVSHWQNAPGGPPKSIPIWPLVHREGFLFAAAKCCQAGVLDPEFHANWSAMRSYDDWCRIAYMYAVSGMKPADQAKKFRALVGSEFGPRDGVMVDIETSRTDPTPLNAAQAAALLDATAQAFQRAPICYIGNFYPNDVDRDPRVQEFPWWLPWYRQTRPPWPRTPAIWQWTSGAEVPGIAGGCDMNEVVSPLVLLAACKWPTATPPPLPPEDQPMWNPPLTLAAPVCDELIPPDGKGVWLLGTGGEVYTFGGAQFYGCPAGHDYWHGRVARCFAALTDAEKAAGKQYVVLSTAGERYAYPGV